MKDQDDRAVPRTDTTGSETATGWFVFRAESPDDIRVPMDTTGLPDGDFLAVVSVPCPAGRFARGGVGGQAFTACSFCGHPSPSTAMARHDGPMLVPVLARKDNDGLVFRRATQTDLTTTTGPAVTGRDPGAVSGLEGTAKTYPSTLYMNGTSPVTVMVQATTDALTAIHNKRVRLVTIEAPDLTADPTPSEVPVAGAEGP